MFFSRVPAVHAVRQAALNAAYASHPERFPNGAPEAALPPASVHINPLEALVVSVGSDAAVAKQQRPARARSALSAEGASRLGEDAATRGASHRNRSTSLID